MHTVFHDWHSFVKPMNVSHHTVKWIDAFYLVLYYILGAQNSDRFKDLKSKVFCYLYKANYDNMFYYKFEQLSVRQV